ncbi:MAG: EamA family transporter [Burkholderiales bacterium]|jgi:drug/metabolite transporter (DMT)-like permease|nr:MAG: EamA family transporter [Burkholderiales bacterium]
MNDARTLPPSAVTTQVLLCMIWGLGQVATKVGNSGISPVWQAALRSIGAALLLSAWIFWRRIRLREREETIVPGVFVGVLFALEFVCLFVGLVYTTAVRAVLLLYSAPFFVALGAHAFVPGDQLTRQKIVGLAAAFAGLAIAFGGRVGTAEAGALLGDALCLGAAFFWASTTIVIKTSSLRRAPAELTLLYQLGVSAIVLVALSYAFGERGVFAPSPIVWASLAFQTVVIACASYLAWFWLVAHYRATTLHAFTFLTPLFGVLAGAALLDEPIGASLVVALALIAAGIVLVNRA